MKSYVLTLFLTFALVQTHAVPADRVARNITQPDGSTLMLRQIGDENIHYFLTMDGFVIKEGEDGGFYYAVIKDGLLCSSSVLSHNEGMRDISEKMFVAKRLDEDYDAQILVTIREVHQQMVAKNNVRRLSARNRTLGIPTTYIGKKRGLVVLVEFPDLQMSSQTANSEYSRMFNESGYSENNHVGSVHDYFFDQSYGKFDLSFDVVGPVTVSRKYGYYGSDSMSGYNDMNVGEMIVEACKLADEFVDYKNYDWDSDGKVDQVFIIYAGYGQATGGASNTIWPHESYLAEDLTLDDVIISQYACSNEIYKGGNGEKDMLMGIGTACHEFSHCLGLPDLYDTDYSGAYGMSYWSLMNSGSYSGPNSIGEVPCGYSAYERWFAGWLEFIDLESSQKVEPFPCLENAPIAYRIKNEGNENEFFTFENRQPNKWFKYISQYEGMHGMLVVHIDYDVKAWVRNKVNPTPRHQRMSPVVADNSYGLSYSDLAADLFPGYGNVTELTNNSHEDYGGMLFNKNTDGTYHINKSILNIREGEGDVSFDVIFNDEIPTPYAIEASDITDKSFTAKWISNGNADSYAIELEIIKNVKPFMLEKVIIDDICQTEYAINNLDALYCNYRVRANKGDLHTEWSNMIEVVLRDYSGVNSLKVDKTLSPQLYSINGYKIDVPQKGAIYIGNKHKMIWK